MAKTTVQEAHEVTPEAVSNSLTLAEFCIRLSATDTRVELIGGFEASERGAGRVKDTEAAYAARYQDFINKPA